MIIAVCAREALAGNGTDAARNAHQALASLSHCGSYTDLTALTGDRVQTKDGVIFRLAGVKAPEIWGPDSDYKNWPYADTARDALHALLSDQALTFYCDETHKDRFGVQSVHIVTSHAVWIQRQLLTAGHAFYFPLPDEKVGLNDLYEAEQIARRQKRGLWQISSYQPKDGQAPDILAKRTGRFEIVYGHVAKVARVGRQTFLNFDDNWRRDFTIEINDRTGRLFKDDGIDPIIFEGQKVEVRGWVDYKSGPRILLLAPAHIRLIGDTP